MHGADDQETPVRAKAALVDPKSMTVLWTSETGSQALSDTNGGPASGVPLDEAVPMADAMGVPEALREVADTGMTRHLRADLVSTARGAMALVTSIHRLPDGRLLVMTEQTWHAGQGKGDPTGPRRPGRRSR